MDGQSFSAILYTTNANLAINCLDLLLENVCSLESGVAIHRFVLVKVCKGLHLCQPIELLVVLFIGSLKKEDIQVLQCPELTNPEWGTVNITENARGLFVAVYKCMPQYSISGDKLRFCSPTSGQWSGAVPRCLPSNYKASHHSLYSYAYSYVHQDIVGELCIIDFPVSVDIHYMVSCEGS